MVSITHAKVSGKADGMDATKIQPSDWNNDHVVDGLVGVQTIWVPAGAMTPRLSAGARPGSLETATNKIMVQSLDFSPDTVEYAQFTVRMPKSWDLGTVSASFTWSNAVTSAGTFNTVWGMQGLSISNQEPLDSMFGTAQYVIDDAQFVGDVVCLSGTTGAIDLAGVEAAEDLVVFQVMRKSDDAADTLAVDAKLIGVTVYYNTNAATDD